MLFYNGMEDSKTSCIFRFSTAGSNGSPHKARIWGSILHSPFGDS